MTRDTKRQQQGHVQREGAGSCLVQHVPCDVCVRGCFCGVVLLLLLLLSLIAVMFRVGVGAPAPARARARAVVCTIFMDVVIF